MAKKKGRPSEAAKRSPRRSVKLARITQPAGPSLHWPKGAILAYVDRAKRGEPIAHIVTDLSAGRHWIEHRPLRPSQPSAAPRERAARGRPQKRPNILEVLRRDLADHPAHSQRQRAARLGVPLSSLRRYLPLA